MNEHNHAEDMSPEDAAAFLGVEVKNLAPLLERYGVGRYYEPRPGHEFVYERADIEKVKRQVEAESPS